MAMSDTGSSFANWSDDLYRYEHTLVGAADSTIVASTAAAATPTSPASAGSGDGSPSRAAGGALGPRVAGKPAARKRARASRRAPVTLLNTDASNFRAMVQQFTGIPSAPAGPYGGGPPVISFGGVSSGYGFAAPQQPATANTLSFDHHLHQRQQYTGASFGYGSHLQQALAGVGHGDSFAHGLGAAEDRMLLQSMQAAQMMPAARAANHSANNGYFA